VLDALSAACDLLQPTGKDVVTIVTTDSVAACWLIDRIPTVTDGHDDIEVRILTTPAGVAFDPMTAELAIGYGMPSQWPSGDPFLLAAARITAVRAPAIDEGITSPDDLWTRPLLTDDNLIMDWPEFAARVGAPPDVAAGLRSARRFNHSHLALRAAARGHRVTLASSPLADGALDRGKLVRAVDTAISTGHGYYLVRSHVRDSPAARKVYGTFVQHFQSNIDPHSANP
jgi:LysR family glycine cleavage system transcriptional activator